MLGVLAGANALIIRPEGAPAVEAGTDVTVDDQVVSVTLEDGAQVGPFSIGALLPRRARALHHVTLELEDVT